MNGLCINKKIILASASPRRHHLLEQTGLKFTVLRGEVNEDYPDGLTPEEIAIFLSEKKAIHFSIALKDNDTILITADTIVCLDGHVLGKPENYGEALRMLELLSGKKHTVYTGVTLKSLEKTVSFCSATDVYFKTLTRQEIDHYIEHYRPYDKAGGYGIQEWIGYIGIEKIDGSYFNVVGMPVQKLYQELKNF